MKNLKLKTIKNLTLATAVIGLAYSCDRDLSDDAVVSTFPNTPDIFTDTPVGMGSDFYFPYGDSKFTAFSIDESDGYQSSASIRIDVPNDDDPDGAYAGGILRIDGAGRDLTKYDALTFWTKASQGVTIDEIGFGEDFAGNTYQTTLQNVSVGTNWTKVIVPIPDASKLTQERGMLRYAMGTQNTGGSGYTVWLDEVRFEKLGTLAQYRPAIFNSENRMEDTFIGATASVIGLTQTVNAPTGQDVTVIAAPAYFDFESTNNAVATVDDQGSIEVLTAGTTTISATLNGIDAMGSLELQSLGNFVGAPVPTRDPANVISLFSDAYTNVNVDFYNGYFAPFQTTQGQDDISINGDNIIRYTELNFVASEFKNPTVNASAMSHLHVDIQVEDPTILTQDFIRIQLGDFGPDGVFGGGDDTSGNFTINNTQLTSGSWLSFDIPLDDFTGLTSRNNLAQLFFITDGTNPNNPGTITNILVDNMYFYQIPSAPTVAAPAPTDAAANVISMFSDAYTDVPVDTWRTSWSAADFQDVMIAGNATKEYDNLDFVGIETVNNQIDASSMTHFRMDVWSSTFTSFSIKLVDFGADGVFGGGDDTEHQIDFTAPAQSTWINYDIPLTDFTGLTSTSNIAQIILVAQPTGSTKVFVDNVYFRN